MGSGLGGFTLERKKGRPEGVGGLSACSHLSRSPPSCERLYPHIPAPPTLHNPGSALVMLVAQRGALWLGLGKKVLNAWPQWEGGKLSKAPLSPNFCLSDPFSVLNGAGREGTFHRLWVEVGKPWRSKDPG